MKNIKPKTALISVSQKEGIIELAKTLEKFGVDIISTGGTAKHLREAGITVKDVSDVTQHEEIMDGRVKTLHPRIHGGILGRRDHAGDLAKMEELSVPAIDIVIVNLYPFENTLKQTDEYAELIENIDIGGPAMVRAAAKNHQFVTIITDAEDYLALSEELLSHDGQTSFEFRKNMAAIAFQRTAQYDSMIANWMTGDKFPRRFVVGGTLQSELRYGENPHQRGAFYASGDGGFANGVLHQGKPLSFNNINDADAAFALANEFYIPAVAIIKHAIPSGVASAEVLEFAYDRALHCDEKSAFGGVVALNREIDADTAKKITDIFTEVVIAPSVSAEALAIFAKKPNLRLLEMKPSIERFNYRPVAGGILLQDADVKKDNEEGYNIVTKRSPSEAEMNDLRFAWNVVKHAKSNAVIFAKDLATIGVGAGQVSRVDAVEQALKKADEISQDVNGSVVASDAFFPFRDGVDALIKKGAKAIIQPGGSMRDEDVIAACDEANVAMIFTGRRHFRH